MVFGLDSRCACDLADIADGLLVSGGVPVCDLPRAGGLLTKQGGDVFSVEGMAVFATIPAPEMVEVDFHFGVGSISGEHLAVDRAVLSKYGGFTEVGCELGRDVGTVVLVDKEGGSKLVEQRSFESV